MKPIERMIDSAGLRCTMCNAPKGECGCWQEPMPKWVRVVIALEDSAASLRQVAKGCQRAEQAAWCREQASLLREGAKMIKAAHRKH